MCGRSPTESVTSARVPPTAHADEERPPPRAAARGPLAQLLPVSRVEGSAAVGGVAVVVCEPLPCAALRFARRSARRLARAASALGEKPSLPRFHGCASAASGVWLAAAAKRRPEGCETGEEKPSAAEEKPSAATTKRLHTTTRLRHSEPLQASIPPVYEEAFFCILLG